jgi:hypothetical protein
MADGLAEAEILEEAARIGLHVWFSPLLGGRSSTP